MAKLEVLMAILILMALFIPGIQAAMDEHTVALWLFNEGKGDEVADSSGHGHNGVFDGNPEWAEAMSVGLQTLLPVEPGGRLMTTWAALKR